VKPTPPPRSKPAPEIVAQPTQSDAPIAATRVEDKVVLVGVLILFLFAAGFIALVSYYGGLE
jgi:hypothetical protein